MFAVRGRRAASPGVRSAAYRGGRNRARTHCDRTRWSGCVRSSRIGTGATAGSNGSGASRSGSRWSLLRRGVVSDRSTHRRRRELRRAIRAGRRGGNGKSADRSRCRLRGRRCGRGRPAAAGPGALRGGKVKASNGYPRMGSGPSRASWMVRALGIAARKLMASRRLLFPAAFGPKRTVRCRPGSIVTSRSDLKPRTVRRSSMAVLRALDSPDGSAGPARSAEAMADFGGRPATRRDLPCRTHRQRWRQRTSVVYAHGRGRSGGASGSNARSAGWTMNGNRPRLRRRGHHRKPPPAA